jgi:hypothetical protein
MLIAHYESGFRIPDWNRPVLIAAALGIGLWLLIVFAEKGPEAARAMLAGEVGGP